MAMTAAVKDELSRVVVTKPCCRKSEMAALLRFAGGLHIVAGRVVVEAELDTGNAARRLRQSIAEVYGHGSEVHVLTAGGLRGSGPDHQFPAVRGEVAVDLSGRVRRSGARVAKGRSDDCGQADLETL